MIYRELPALPDKLADGDVLVDCNLSCAYDEGKELDFQGLSVTLRSCNCFNSKPVNADRVVLEDTPSFGRESTPDDSEAIDPVKREVDTITSRLAEIAVDNPDMVAASMAEKSDALPMDAIATAISTKPIGIRPAPIGDIKVEP